MLLRAFGVGLANPSVRRGASPRGQRPRVAGWLLAGWLVAVAWLHAGPARAAPVEVQTLQRSAEPHAGIAIDYDVKLELPAQVIDVLRRGIPLSFQAQAVLLRPRWYWRDERIARAARSWRLAWQPLTSDWRVVQGSLTQQHATLEEALATMTRATNWLVAEPHRLQPDDRYLLIFTWRLDTSQLPAPMQIEAGGTGWNLRADAEFGVVP